MSIYDEMKRQATSGDYPMHMPGHKRNVKLLEDYQYDFTEIPGLDDLHHPQGVIKDAMDYITAAMGAKSSFIGVNGATGLILSSIQLAVNNGDWILIARNCHKSVYNACIIKQLNIGYLYPKCGVISPEDVLEALNDKKKAYKAVVITSPSYDGYVSDIEAISQICKKKGLTLIVDEAHGAHLPLAGKAAARGYVTEGFFPESAIGKADLVISSAHKTLPAMTQTAILSLCSDRFSVEEVQRAISLYETSSPSYVLMASAELSVKYVVERFKTIFADFELKLREVYDLAEKEADGLIYPLMPGRDPSKIVISARNLPMTGKEIYDILKDKFGIVSEMFTMDYVLLLTSLSDSEEGFRRVKEAIKYLAGFLKDEKQEVIAYTELPRVEVIDPISPKGKKRFNRLASLKKIRKFEEEKTRGERLEELYIAEDLIIPYPPGYPVLVPGEAINLEVIELLEKAYEAGQEVYGLMGDRLYCQRIIVTRSIRRKE